jgi:hypothetical protein
MTIALETGWLASTPVEDTLLRRYLHNQADLNALLAAAGGGEVVRDPAAVLTWYATPVVFLNQAVLLQPPTEQVLDEVDRFYAGRSATLVSAWPTPDLTARGWQLMGHPTFVARGPQPGAVSPAAGVAVSVADTAADLALAERLAVEGYPMPAAAGAPANSVFPAGLLGSAFTVRLGHLDGRAVSVAASHVSRGVLNLCLAATLPQGRRRGVWEALAQARLADAPHLPAAATTSDFSRAGFEKLGFLPVTRLTMWVRDG